MDGSHPKRKKDRDNPYTLTGDKENHILLFKDSTGTIQKLPIDTTLYELFDRFELDDISHMNVVSRYWEQSALTEETLNTQAVQRPPTVEEAVFLSCEKEALHKAIRRLSQIQQRRLYLYYWEGLTYEQIATLENCSHPAVIKSINSAIKKLKKIFSDQGYNLADK
jgi:RNA polymerase sigma-70 factor (ECF subfamily)